MITCQYRTFAICFRDVAQPGSVLAWGARGRWFESSHPDHKNPLGFAQGIFFCQIDFKNFIMVRPFFLPILLFRGYLTDFLKTLQLAFSCSFSLFFTASFKKFQKNIVLFNFFC